MKVFIIGITGGTGSRIAERLLRDGHAVGGLVRSRAQADALVQKGMVTVVGDIATIAEADLTAAMRGSDVVVFSAGAGGGGDEATRAVDGKGPGKAASAAQRAGISRIYLVSVFPEAWREKRLGHDFDYYIREKKNAEVDLVGREIDWVILRPSALLDDPGTGRVSLGFAEIHEEITRDDVAAT